MKPQSPIHLHLTRYYAPTPGDVRIEDKMITGNELQAVGVSAVKGRKGVRVIVKHDGHTWELHRNKNTDLFKRVDKDKALKAQLWTAPDTETWLPDAAWIALSEISYRQ